jgi:hypothetical protein
MTKSERAEVALFVVIAAVYVAFIWDMRKRSIASDKTLIREYKSAVSEVTDRGNDDAG